MKVMRIIAFILVSLGISFIFACGWEKTASLEENETMVAVLQKVPESL